MTSLCMRYLCRDKHNNLTRQTIKNPNLTRAENVSNYNSDNSGLTDKKNFLKLCSEMDIGLQVSFSETFNIVGCDILTASELACCAKRLTK